MEQRTTTQFCVKLEITAIKKYEMFKTTCGEECVLRTTVLGGINDSKVLLIMN